MRASRRRTCLAARRALGPMIVGRTCGRDRRLRERRRAAASLPCAPRSRRDAGPLLARHRDACGTTPMFGFGKTTSDPLADVKSAERWLAAFPPNDPLAVHGELLAELGAIAERDAQRTPAAARGGVLRSTRSARGCARRLTAQYIEHASRSSKIENQLWSALFDLTQAIPARATTAFAREMSDHAQSAQVAGAAAGARSRRQIVHWGSTRRSGSTATSSGFRRSGRSCTRCSRSRARGRSSASWSRSAAGGTDDDRARVPASRCVLQLMNAGNLTARHLEWVAASSTSGARRCA